MIEKKIKVGVIGCGFISQVTHIPNLIAHPNVDLVALADKRIVLAKNIATRYGIKNTYRNHLEMIKNEELDAVVVVVRRVHTAGIVSDCLRAGMHVFSEKPMAQTISQASELAHQAESRGLFYCIGYMRRHDFGTVNLKKYLCSKEIDSLGRMLHAEMLLVGGDDYCAIGPYLKTSEPRPIYSKNRAAPAFIPDQMVSEYEKFLNVCGHNVNLLRYFFGNELSCSYCKFIPQGISSAIFDNSDTTLQLRWRIDNKLSIWEEKLTIFYEFGEINLEFNPAFLKNTSGKLVVKDYLKKSVIMLEGDHSWSFNKEISAFIDLLSGKSNLFPSFGNDCVADYNVIDSMWLRILNQDKVFI